MAPLSSRLLKWKKSNRALTTKQARVPKRKRSNRAVKTKQTRVPVRKNSENTDGARIDYSWRVKRGNVYILPSILNAGLVDDCMACAYVSTMEALYRLKEGNTLSVRQRFFREKLLWLEFFYREDYFFTQPHAINFAIETGFTTDFVTETMKDDVGRRYKAKGFHQYRIALEGDEEQRRINISQVKHTLRTKGPVVGCFKIFEDFPLDNNSSIIYRAEEGKLEYGNYMAEEEANTMQHTVMIVGYGKESGTKYWIFQNHWGTEWGEQGFGRIEITKLLYATSLYLDRAYSVRLENISWSRPDSDESFSVL